MRAATQALDARLDRVLEAHGRLDRWKHNADRTPDLSGTSITIDLSVITFG